ncbi:hypothetical protein [Bacillus phage phiAGATE]|uniref:Uncharacterized protein n=1 Tax=Bacillus phage phiAGATE TaxID=1204533 RepID=L0L967_9CAUD|nr:hypothetical protein G380_gp033 [Bacillus phage phiAGATE]AGB62683.1 hypothetical protein [Bacillus phage phiAGATE]
MSREITVNPRVRDLPPQVVKGALYRAVNSVGVKSMLGNSTVLHVYEWLTGFVDTGVMNQNRHSCPACRVDPNCKVCCFIQDHFNTLRYIIRSEPLAELATLMREIKLRADSAPYVKDKDEELIVAVTTSYLLEASEGINKEVLKAELSEMEENGDFCLKGLNEHVYFDEKFEALPLDALSTFSEQEVEQESVKSFQKAPHQNFARGNQDEWENVTPIQQPRAYEMTNMDIDSLLDLYNYYTQLNSFYKDGSFDKKLGLIKAVFTDRTKKATNHSGSTTNK